MASDSSGGEDLKLDFSKLKNLKHWFTASKQAKLLITFLLIAIPVILTFYVRLLPQGLPATDNWAASSVDNYYRNQIASSINSQYPNLPAANKEALVNQQYADFVKTNAKNMADQIKSTSAYFKTGFQYQENNHTYTFLGDLDSYFFLRYARNILDKGMVCDEIKDGRCWDNHMFAPTGNPIDPMLHPYGIFYLYKFLHAINPSVNLMQSAFLLPTFLAALAAIAAFFVGRRIMNPVGGFFAAMFLAMSPMFLSRTLGSDTDIWNVMFPLIILWLFLEAFETESWVKKGVFALAAGLVSGMFAFAWPNGWWYIFDLLLLTLVGFIIFSLVQNYLHHKHLGKVVSKEVMFTGMALLILLVSSAIFVSLFTSTDTFKSAFTDPFGKASALKAAAHADFWPNIQTTVAELNEASIETIVKQAAFGVNIFFGLALLGIMFTLVARMPSLKESLLLVGSAIIFAYLTMGKGLSLSIYSYLGILMIPLAIGVFLLLTDKGSRVDIKPAILLTIWFVGMIFASTKGVRFIQLLIPAFAVAIGVSIGYVYQLLSKLIHKEFKINETLVKVVVFILLCFLLSIPIRAGEDAGKGFVPSMTKGWWDSLTQIKDQSQPSAIINSWWDFGHWFKYVADRPVTVDGSGQDYELAHWMGTILVTGDEHQAVNTIRMLDCGSRETYHTLLADTGDILLSVNLTKTIIMQEKEQAIQALKKAGVTDPAIDKAIGYAFCQPPEHFIIASEDMVGKSGVWAHFGYWDFNKAYMIVNVRPKGPEEGIKIIQEKFGYSEDEASRLYYDMQALQTDREMNDWISPWPSYFMSSWVGCSVAPKDVPVEETDENGTVTHSVEQKPSLIGCSINREIGQGTQGTTVIENVVLDLNNYTNSTIIAGVYNPSTGQRIGGGKITPNAFVILDNTTSNKIKMDSVTFNFDVLIDTVNNQALIMDPLLSESLFTKLFYLDGRYTTHFEKFSDITDITGSRIIVYKVKWDPGVAEGKALGFASSSATTAITTTIESQTPEE